MVAMHPCYNMINLEVMTSAGADVDFRASDLFEGRWKMELDYLWLVGAAACVHDTN